MLTYSHCICVCLSGEHLEKIVPMVVKFCNVEDDELREYCFQAFEAFVRRYGSSILYQLYNVIEQQSSKLQRYGVSFCHDMVIDCIMH